MILGNMKLSLYGIDGLTTKQSKVLNFLYAPLIHPLSLKFYHLLLSLNDYVMPLDYQLISTLLDCTLEECEAARLDLEKVLLIKTFQNKNTHQIEICPPKSSNDFVHHALLGRMFVLECGSDRLNLVNTLIKEKSQEVGMKEISYSVNLSLLKDYDQQKEEAYQQQIKDLHSMRFDLDLFLSNTNDLMFPKRLRTVENLELISNLANQYQLTLQQLRQIIVQSISRKGDKLNIKQLTQLASSHLIEIESTDDNPLKWSSAEFLQHKMGNIPILETHLNNIDYIRQKYKFNDEVLNVLIDFSLNNNKGNLNKRYLDSIAASMHLNKVKTLQDAINHFAYETKKKSKQTNTIIEFSDYKDQITSGEVSQEDQDRIRKAIEKWK